VIPGNVDSAASAISRSPFKTANASNKAWLASIITAPPLATVLPLFEVEVKTLTAGTAE